MIERYVKVNNTGIVTLTARAVTPDGQQINSQVTININAPAASTDACYTGILGLYARQNTAVEACSQIGTLTTYYLGNPKSRIYLNQNCSGTVSNGFYRTQDDKLINILGGAVVLENECSFFRQDPVLEMDGGSVTTSTSTTVTTSTGQSSGGGGGGGSGGSSTFSDYSPSTRYYI